MRPAHMAPRSGALLRFERFTTLLIVFIAVDFALWALEPIVGEWWAGELEVLAMLGIGILIGAGRL